MDLETTTYSKYEYELTTENVTQPCYMGSTRLTPKILF